MASWSVHLTLASEVLVWLVQVDRVSASQSKLSCLGSCHFGQCQFGVRFPASRSNAHTIWPLLHIMWKQHCNNCDLLIKWTRTYISLSFRICILTRWGLTSTPADWTKWKMKFMLQVWLVHIHFVSIENEIQVKMQLFCLFTLIIQWSWIPRVGI